MRAFGNVGCQMKHSGYQKITRVELFCFIPKWNDAFLLSECRIGLRFFSLQTSASFKQKVLLLKNPSNSKSGLALTLGTVGSSPTGMIFLGFTSPHTAHPAMAHASAQPSPPPKPPAHPAQEATAGICIPKVVWTAGLTAESCAGGS